MRSIRTKAFSLLEVMIVLAIMGTVVITAPPIYQWMGYQGIGHAVDQLRCDLQLARLMAIRRKQPCTVQLNSPLNGQYRNGITHQVVDLGAYRGGVHFLSEGPDRNKMSSQISFNSRGMAVPAGDIYISNQDHTKIFRILVLMPGSISTYEWSNGQWR